LNDDELSDYARSYISHGRVFGGDFDKFQNEWVDRFLFDKVGVSYRSNNLLGAFALSQLSQLDDAIKKRQRNGRFLSNALRSGKLPKYFYVPNSQHWRESVFQFFPIVIKDRSIDRSKLLSFMFQNNIDSRVLLSLINQPIFKQLYGDLSEKFPNAAYYNDYGFLVGCHQDLSCGDMDQIVRILEKYIEGKK